LGRHALPVGPQVTSNGGDERRRLVLVRHAKSSWDDPTLSDHDRPLARRGRKALERMRPHLEHRGVRPDVVLCSSARRTRETLDGIRGGLGGHPRIEIEDGLYGAGADQIVARLERLDDAIATALVIGHNPGIADLVDQLAATDQAVPTGAIADLSFTGPWSTLGSTAVSLDDLWRPRG
jgi:phosphohistidine phosphatase